VRLNLRQSGPWIAAGGILAELFIAFPAFFSIIDVHAFGIVLIATLLLIQVVVVARLATWRPAWCVYVPAIGLVAYFLLLYLGARWWGWST